MIFELDYKNGLRTADAYLDDIRINYRGRFGTENTLSTNGASKAETGRRRALSAVVPSA
jgi:hypothetical protein